VNSSTTTKETIAIILSMVIPGAGHIYLGKEYKVKGVKIAILFVIVNFISFNILRPFLFGLLGSGYLPDILLSPILFVPIFIIWYKQLSNILNITREIDMKYDKI
jgi:hypothetical protein